MTLPLHNSISTIQKDSRGNVIVDNYMKTNLKNVYAVGDIASFPLRLPTFSGEEKWVNIGHWQLASAHGRCAGLNIGLSSCETKQHGIKTVPFFWTVQFGKSIRYAGHAPDGYDDVVYDGTVE